MRTPNRTLVQSGLDYITLTASSSQDSIPLYARAVEFLNLEYRLGNRNRPISPNGYEGILCGHVFAGKQGDNVMVRVSGKLAGAFFLDTVGLDVSCTRIDLQATYRLDEDDEKYGHKEQHKALAARRSSGKTHLGHIRHIIGNGAGDTTSVGSRSSSRYGRLYDKQRESDKDEYKCCWRYELELKKPLSDVIRNRLVQADLKEPVVLGTIKWQWGQWGFDVSFIDTKAQSLEGLPASSSDVDRKLEWIKRQVGPSMSYCVEKGYGDQLAMVIEQATGLVLTDKYGKLKKD